MRDGKEDQRSDEDPGEDDELDWRLGLNRDLGEEVGNTPENSNEQEESPCLFRQLALNIVSSLNSRTSPKSSEARSDRAKLSRMRFDPN